MSIELKGISKHFLTKNGLIQALKSVDLRIDQGEFVGLLGPNGAGKTTLTRILSTLIIPDEGEGYIDGISLQDYKNIRKKISVAFGENGGRSLYYRLTVKDNLLFFATLAGVPKKHAVKRITALLDYFNLREREKVLTMKLSTGMRSKLLLIRALIPNTPVLLLDEPTLGFDAVSAEKAKELLKVFNREFGTTILLTSHNFGELDELAKRLLLIDSGSIVRDCSPYEFKQISAKKAIEIVFKSGVFIEDLFKKEIFELTGAEVRKIEYIDKDTISAKIMPNELSLEKTISRITVALIENGAEVVKINPHFPSLKESFLAFLENKTLTESSSDAYETIVHLE